MDVLRRELQEVFHRHEFRLSALSEADIEACRQFSGINPHTVNTHHQNILQKLSVSNSMEAVQTATAMMLL